MIQPFAALRSGRPHPCGRVLVTPATRSRAADAGHVTAWREATDAVHAPGGRATAQTLTAGRGGHPPLPPGAAAPVAPAAVRPSGTPRADFGPRRPVMPHAPRRDTVAAS